MVCWSNVYTTGDKDAVVRLHVRENAHPLHFHHATAFVTFQQGVTSRRAPCNFISLPLSTAYITISPLGVIPYPVKLSKTPPNPETALRKPRACLAKPPDPEREEGQKDEPSTEGKSKQ